MEITGLSLEQLVAMRNALNEQLQRYRAERDKLTLLLREMDAVVKQLDSLIQLAKGFRGHPAQDPVQLITELRRYIDNLVQQVDTSGSPAAQVLVEAVQDVVEQLVENGPPARSEKARGAKGRKHYALSPFVIPFLREALATERDDLSDELDVVLSQCSERCRNGKINVPSGPGQMVIRLIMEDMQHSNSHFRKLLRKALCGLYYLHHKRKRQRGLEYVFSSPLAKLYEAITEVHGAANWPVIQNCLERWGGKALDEVIKEFS